MDPTQGVCPADHLRDQATESVKFEKRVFRSRNGITSCARFKLMQWSSFQILGDILL